jgi:hypothetical protein
MTSTAQGRCTRITTTGKQEKTNGISSHIRINWQKLTEEYSLKARLEDFQTEQE